MMKKIDQAILLCKECFAEFKVSLFKYKKQFVILLGIYLVAFCSVFRANFAYWDDIGRTYAGYHGWLDWSRYGTEILATFVHAGWHLTDISPLPQLIACAVMAIAGILLLDIFCDGKKIGVFSVIAASLTALAPYFLGMISYKFDSPYMALSFLVCIIPFLFRKKPMGIYMVVSVACLIMMCATYQASSGIYPMIVLFLVMQDIIAGEKVKKCLQFIGISVVCYIVALGFFWLFLMRDNGLSMVAFSKLPSFAANRYITYYKIILHDFSKIWLILLAALAVVFLYAVYRSAVINKFAALGLGIAAVFAGSALCFGANLFISREAFDARNMYGFNFLITMLAVFISFHAKHWVFQMVYAALAWAFAVFSLTYGNALALQQDYRDFRLGLLVGDLNDLEIMKSDEVKEVRIVGDIGYAPVIENMAKEYPILMRESFIDSGDGFICSGLGEGIWGGYYFYHYLNIPDIENASDNEEYQSIPIIKDTMYHTIRGQGDRIVIELK